MPRVAVDPLHQPIHLVLVFVAQRLELFLVHMDAGALHVVQNGNERQFDVLIQILHVLDRELVENREFFLLDLHRERGDLRHHPLLREAAQTLFS